MTLREAKRPVLVDIADALRAWRWDGAPLRVRRNADAVRADIDLGDGARAVLHVATYTLGLPAGQFRLGPSAMLTGGALWSRLESEGALGSGAWLLGVDPSISPRTRDHVPATPRGTAATIRFLTQVAPPVLSSFLGDGVPGGSWTTALAFAEAHPARLRAPARTLDLLRELAGAPGHAEPRRDG